MSNVINLLFETEHKAEETIESAREESRRILKSAEEKAEAIVKKARKEALSLQKEAARNNTAALDKEKEELLNDLQIARSRLLEDSDSALDQAAEEIFELIRRSDFARD
jgi:vacuolar-type H+-ATPase subunit H